MTVTLGNGRVNMDTWQHQYLTSINLPLPAVTVNKCVMLPHRWYTLFTTCKSNEQSKWMWLNTLHRKSSLSFFLSEKCSADRWISNNYHHYSAISPGFCIQESLGLPRAFLGVPLTELGTHLIFLCVLCQNCASLMRICA